MQLSVIIPVFNTEHTLDQCVESVLGQGIDDMEVILVDDGSPDNSPVLCNIWAERDKRIKVIHQTNSGLSEARNAGICIATGDYITFVDSDDYLSPNTYLPLTKWLREHRDIDMLEYCVNGIGGHRHYLTYPDKIYAVAKEYWLRTRAWNHAYACNKLFRRELFHNIRFPKGKLYEDLRLLPYIIRQNPKIATTSHGTYNYVVNAGSISSKPNKSNIMQLLEAEWAAARIMHTHPFSCDGWQLYLAMTYRIVDLIKS